MKTLNGWKLAALFLVLALSAMAQMRMVARYMPTANSDLLVRVVGTRDALKGENPYSGRVTRNIQAAYYGHPLTLLDLKKGADPEHFDYPALIVPLMAPFVEFSWSAIRIAFLCLAVPGFLISSYWWIKIIKPSIKGLTLIALVGLSLLAWPTVWGLRLQQPTLVIAILVAAGCFALVRRMDLMAGAITVVSLIQPQSTLPLALWLLVWSAWHRRWRFMAGFAVTMIALWAMAEHMVPGWFPEWFRSLRSYTSFTAPICIMLAGKWIGWAVTALLELWSVWVLWGMLKWESDTEGFARALALALAATVLLIPTEIPIIYDQVILFPAVAVIVLTKPRSHGAMLARKLTLMLLVWDFDMLMLSAVGSLVYPGHKYWVVLPFLDQILPILSLVTLLWMAETEGWSSVGLKRFRERGQKRMKNREIGVAQQV